MAKILTTSEILNYLLTKNDMSEVSLGREIGIPRSTINKITSGRTSDPRVSTLNAIAAYFNITTEQLLGRKPLELEKEQATESLANHLPIIEWNNAKDWLKIREKTYENKKNSKWVLSSSDANEAEFALVFKGESMWPQFQKNVLLIISTKREPKNNDFVVAHIINRDEVIFRKLIIENKYRILKANNLIFPPIQLENEDKIIGTVIQSINNY